MFVSLMTVEGTHHRNFRIDDKNCSFWSPGCVSLMTVEEKHNRNSIWACQAIPQAPRQAPRPASRPAPRSEVWQLRKLYLGEFRTLEVFSNYKICHFWRQMCVSLMTVEGQHHRNFRIDDKNYSFWSPGCVSFMTVKEKHVFLQPKIKITTHVKRTFVFIRICIK